MKDGHAYYYKKNIYLCKTYKDRYYKNKLLWVRKVANFLSFVCTYANLQ